ncbi:hypothetical protein [Flavobacterium sp. GT3R68]|uniref:hypothetical protein n=1 Tax=Flavobacterium sp. GT3R68 TaxID=2594437 RepID=UPI000F86AFD3|nr:hypothetical protein [Flavobacterium sp. GT3R68]RTY93910.1 hypothetical protein EKL32_13580 [Flavobacterium sp. GSN2]TRW93475.1 hypothetical protein FNW07_00805 [Flavobacterium sp. GT3R68]
MKKITVLSLLFISSFVMAQKMTVLSGDFKNLKGISEYNLTFDYSNLKVDKFATEEEFLADKMKKREEKGTDEDFKKSWFSDREERYEPKFIESFNKRFDNGAVKVAKNSPSNYTLNVKSVWIYPGYNVGVMRSSSKLDTVVTVFETANPGNVLISLKYDKALGSGAAGFDYNSGYRISEAYAKLAKEFAFDLKSKTK